MLKSLLIYLPVIAFVAMHVAMWLPSLWGRRGDGSNDVADTRQERADLREEIRHLKAERPLGEESGGA
jgi:hypothetical protein